jgi:hypothetical protein
MQNEALNHVHVSMKREHDLEPVFRIHADAAHGSGGALKSKTPTGARHAANLATDALLDFGFLELDMLLDDRIVFLEHEFLGLGASVLLGDIEKAGVGGRQQLDLDHGGLCHRSFQS